MNRIRLLPLVLVAVSALLAVKILDLAMGTGSFATGPGVAAAAGGGEGESGGEGAPPPGGAAADALLAPVDLSAEYKRLQEQQKAAAAHPASGEGGHAAPAEPAKPTAAGEGTATAGDAKPAAGEPAAAAGEPAGHGGGASGHGGKAAGSGAYVQRPAEYAPPIGSAEQGILDGLAERRQELDKREQDIDLRFKLLQAAEQRLNKRLDDLKSISTQLGDTATQKQQDTQSGEQTAALVSLYENMKPKAAAAVFETLDAPVLLDIARHMNPRKLSPVLAAMNPDKAAALTAAMASVDAAKRIIVTTEAVAPGQPAPAPPTPSRPDPASLPQIMPAAPAR